MLIYSCTQQEFTYGHCANKPGDQAENPRREVGASHIEYGIASTQRKACGGQEQSPESDF